MSDSSKASTPVSDLGRLTISSTGDMAVTTRSQRKRALPPSSPSSASAAAGPSRTEATASHRSQRQRREASAPPDPGEGDDGGDDDDDDPDSSDDGGNDPQPPANVQPGGVVVREILAAFHPTGRFPREFSVRRPTDTSVETAYITLGGVLVQEINDRPDFLTALTDNLPRRTPLWCQMIARGQAVRLSRILREYHKYRINHASGNNVPKTAQALIDLDTSAGEFLEEYRNILDAEGRGQIVRILVKMLRKVVDLNQTLNHMQQIRPEYAVDEEELNNLYVRLIINPPQGQERNFVLDSLRLADPFTLSRCQGDIQDIQQALTAHHTTSTLGRPEYKRNAPVPYLRRLDGIVAAIAEAVRTTAEDEQLF